MRWGSVFDPPRTPPPAICELLKGGQEAGAGKNMGTVPQLKTMKVPRRYGNAEWIASAVAETNDF